MEYDYEPLRDPENIFTIARKELENEILIKSLQLNENLESITSRSDFFDWFEKPLFDLEKKLIYQREALSESRTYFFGCSFEVYKLNYDARLQSYLKKYFDATEQDFIDYELGKKFDYYFDLRVDRYDLNQKFEYSIICDSVLMEQILFSLKARNKFLTDKLNVTATTEAIEPEAIDLGDTSATEKIIYLHKLGIIDFLRTKQPFQSSTNSLATVLSAITGINPETRHIQSMLNPIFNKEVNQKNNPLNSQKTVLKVETQLKNIGFNQNETI
jgi:hypothetical protein